MEEWKEYKLGEVAIQVRDRIETSNLDSSSYISTENMLPNKAGVTLSSGIPSGNAIKFKNGDVLISNIRPYFKKIWRADIVGGCSADVICLRASKEIEPLFLYYLLSQDLFFDYVMQGAKGTKMPRGDKNQIMQWPIMLPSIKEQQGISAILKSLDDKIEVNRQINDNLEQQAQALFKSWFVDFEPFKDGEFVESEMGMIPKGWRVESLTSFGKIVCGKTPSKAESTYYGGNIPFIKIPDMHNNVFVLQSEDCLSELGDKSQIGKRIPPYSVLVSCIATVGLVTMNVRTCHTNQQINTIIPNSTEYRYYLYQKLVSLKDYLINLGRGGTATLNVNTRQFGNIEIVKPSDNVLGDYHQRVSCLFDKIEANSKESRHLAELRDTLLPKLMSGELKVNEVEL